MKLTSAHITNFRCIDDSTPFSLGDVTCFVGKNESGKTSILHALERLNPLDPETTKPEKLRDFPRHLLTDFDERKPILLTKWELDQEDIQTVERQLGPGALKQTTIEVTKQYTKETSWAVEIDEGKVIEWLLAETACDPSEREQFAACKDALQLKAKAQELKPKGSARVAALLERVAKFKDSRPVLTAIDVLCQRMPRFLYFSSYDRMAGTVHLETLAQHKQHSQLMTRSDEVAHAFLAYAGTTLEEIQTLNTYEAIKARVEAASIKISKQIFAYWSQNRHLKVEFSVEPGRVGDPAPFNSGTVMRTRIHNKLHDMTVPFDDRSAGFTWFFSFLVLFSQVQKKFGNVIILLDEPGLNLHGKAQGDLVRFIYDKLRGKHQVIYSTHSPFMVPTEDLASVRTVEDVVNQKPDGEVEVRGTKVGDEVLSTDRDTLFPLQNALGYEITQSLFIGKHSLVVEGPSDILYIQAFSADLRRRKRESLDQRWTLCPSGGIDKVAAFVSLFSGNKLDIAVLADIAQGQKGKVEALRRNGLLSAGRVLTTTQFCSQTEADIEDLIGRPVYVELLNRTYDLKGSSAFAETALVASGESSPRVVRQVEAVITSLPSLPEFDHFAPASWLIQHPEFFDSSSPDVASACDRFERLFSALNKLLPANR